MIRAKPENLETYSRVCRAFTKISKRAAKNEKPINKVASNGIRNDAIAEE